MSLWYPPPSGAQPILYAIQICGPGHPIKIGITGQLTSRLSGYRSHCPYPFRLLLAVAAGPHAEQAERDLFAALRAYSYHPIRPRGVREWFRPDAEVVRALSVIAARFPKFDNSSAGLLAAHLTCGPLRTNTPLLRVVAGLPAADTAPTPDSVKDVA